ncbi:ornithine carbamoyltransferase [Anaplasma centrale str. Israel]|uniref:Ornithine carbamoyltransferase n=1 Tax=Anaplasma centrale (strain Israel) TaxID=574556 RepID=D1ATI7_ANACI|nr:ornithine carbamoyltransferase [Anaplasma centrale]ACZ48865.1 ornithine carbamoyltransferase [Anaplasma centrale str. Israel]
MDVAGAGVRSFIDISCCGSAGIRATLDFVLTIGTAPGMLANTLTDKNVAMVFCQQSSTRTRISPEVGINHMGGRATVPREGEMQLHGGDESVRDTAIALSQCVDRIVLRAASHTVLLEMESHSSVPAISALTKESHPSQVLADILTYEAEKGHIIPGRTVARIGSDANVLNSWVQAAAVLKLMISTPPRCLDNTSQKVATAQREGVDIVCEPVPARAVPDADIATTDSWYSMGTGTEPADREALYDYQANQSLMELAKPGHMFLHCTPAYVGQEASKVVLYGTSSCIAEEAGNKLHIQKAVLARCFGLL